MTLEQIAGILGALSVVGGGSIWIFRQVSAWIVRCASHNEDVKALKNEIEALRRTNNDVDKQISIHENTIEANKEQLSKMDDRFSDLVTEIFKLLKDNNI